MIFVLFTGVDIVLFNEQSQGTPRIGKLSLYKYNQSYDKNNILNLTRSCIFNEICKLDLAFFEKNINQFSASRKMCL